MKHTIIRLIALVLAALLCLGLAACGGNGGENSDPAPKKTTTTTAAEGEDAQDTTSTTAEAEDTTTAAPDKTEGSKATTTSRTKNVQGGITYTTSTAAPTTSAPKNPIRILAIGHSFAVDALRAHMWNLLENQGYDYIVVAYLFTPSCSLNEQWDRMQGKADHEQYCKTDGYTGAWSQQSPPSDSPYNKVQYAIRDEKWDIITLQPDPDYGGGPEIWPSVTNDYANLGNIVKWINDNKTNKNAKLYYHMTWAFAEDCKLWCFDERSPYKGDQLKHYRSFVDATMKYVLDPYGNKFAGIIPAGTAVQNARTSKLGDTFNMPGGWVIENKQERDGYHLNDKGDYLAALTWFAVITGKSAKTATYKGGFDAEFEILAESVDNAIKTWDDVTQSKFK